MPFAGQVGDEIDAAAVGQLRHDHVDQRAEHLLQASQLRRGGGGAVEQALPPLVLPLLLDVGAAAHPLHHLAVLADRHGAELEVPVAVTGAQPVDVLPHLGGLADRVRP
ncbi:hypothetical protein ACFQ0B_44865 [Nonomuraea thailandensis]